MEDLMRKNSKCLKSSHSANFGGGGGNFLSPRNEGLENGTATPCHPEERSDVGIASSLWLQIAPSPVLRTPSPLGRGMYFYCFQLHSCHPEERSDLFALA